MFVIICSK